MDAHKKILFVAMLFGAGHVDRPERPNAVKRLVRKLEREAPGPVRVCYEAEVDSDPAKQSGVDAARQRPTTFSPSGPPPQRTARVTRARPADRAVDVEGRRVAALSWRSAPPHIARLP